MKIEYQEGGVESRPVITSGFIWWRKHIHLVDEILLRVPQLRAVSEGFFIMTTIISGFTVDVLLAEETAEELGYQLTEVPEQ
ncbi:hypothetical protein ZQ34_004826 [Salmonella enterica subsp. salamae]|nr:hypothetical protein [Salmonella enterica]EDL3488105.1 hypothetical protein [Salmonella enterica subsp. enterica serovar Newport]EDU0502689.1 hypothetical protein [Salmonella enterica subsp. salamae]EDV1506810.1 hypothetical protein [Salmonella enterica subsp. salamae]EEI9684196.1 hypothetical protein [Salmonella enterica]